MDVSHATRLLTEKNTTNSKAKRDERMDLKFLNKYKVDDC